MRLRLWKFGLGMVASAFAVLAGSTWICLHPPLTSLRPENDNVKKSMVFDRHGIPLSVTRVNPWNTSQVVPLHDIPAFLQKAFLVAEDQRFYQHHGVDWLARLHALWQNLRARRFVRGASTITEQVVRMLHPRPRTLWARWLEGWEAMRLEWYFTKADILECYLNQVPYARQRRGVLQASYLYFGRDLSTLSQTEMLALATLVRSPGRLDLIRGTTAIRLSISRLSERLYRDRLLSYDDFHIIEKSSLRISLDSDYSHSSHFLRYVQTIQNKNLNIPEKLYTTIDADLQERAYALLHKRLHDLRERHVTSAALLILNHHTDEVLAWVNAGESHIDAIIVPRQPGSTLKPFLYALALENGWNAATIIDDNALSQQVGAGLHAFRNYSGRHYGPLRLRLALGNSLNIPAIRTIDFVGTNVFWERLHLLGFSSLTRPSEYYGHGLALGNGEVTLLELVQAYAALARHGVWRPAKTLRDANVERLESHRVYSPEVSSLIANILADNEARRLEFGSHGLFNFPVETAIKTGTSSDYRDAWSVGFSESYTVGVWMGNLRQQSMQGVSGSTGPSLVLRSIFAELHRYTPLRPLWMSPALIPLAICSDSGMLANKACQQSTEWFIPPHLPLAMHDPSLQKDEQESYPQRVDFLQPTNGLHLAMDPRIPDALESFTFLLPDHHHIRRTEWIVDGVVLATTYHRVRRFRWPLKRGSHQAMARVWYGESSLPIETSHVTFLVK